MKTRLHAAVRIVAIAILMLATSATFAVAAPDAEAQFSVTGTADFRNAPQLTDGSYRDQVVTGDSAWYSVMYTNDDPYRFEVSIDGAAPSGVEVNVSFVAPTLDAVDGPGAVVDGSGVAYPLGQTNQWFLRVSLETNGQAGVEFPILLTVEGAQDTGTEPCAEIAGCTLDEELSAVNVAIAEAEAELGLSDPQDTVEAVDRELNGLRRSADSAATDIRPAAELRLAQAEAALAQRCAPQTSCDEIPTPSPKTPLLGLIVGLAALGFGVRKALKKIQAAKAEAADDTEAADEGGPEATVPAPPLERAPIAL